MPVKAIPALWDECLHSLRAEIPSQQFNTWIRPLQPRVCQNGVTALSLLAPNQFVLDRVYREYWDKIVSVVHDLSNGHAPEVSIEIGSQEPVVLNPVLASSPVQASGIAVAAAPQTAVDSEFGSRATLNSSFSFENFVEGKSNQLALAAARQVAENPGVSYNPLLLYGGVGLGKTHLLHAIGSAVLAKRPQAKILYLHSERFVADMIKALQNNTIERFKTFYRSVDVLMLDDIQFFVGKERSQEEFFHTFNALHQANQQVILTSDRYPKEIDGLEERLQSRLGWGLTVAVEPPELETRVAILISKAEQLNLRLGQDEAFFIAKRIRSNVRELEGALRRVSAMVRLHEGQTDKPGVVTLDFIQESLKDLFSVQERMISLDNIQKTVAKYYKIRIADLLSKRRSRSITRPRQVAMLLAKELTQRSLPEIGDAFGGRDHTTVLHACQMVRKLREQDRSIEEDYVNLTRLLAA